MSESKDQELTRTLDVPAKALGQSDATIILAAAPAADVNANTVTAPAGSEASTLPVGSRLAEFEITALIGQGGFGAVYEARDHALERIVAIKEYLPAALSVRHGSNTVWPLSQRQRETFDLGLRSFINEARLLAQFDHPSLLKVYRFWQENGTAYMAMPLYRGTTLGQTLAALPGAVDEGWLLAIVDGLTQALAVMHTANCYHRDIAPDNIILLEDSGRPVLLDFGAARRVITDKTQALTVILKPGYAPIEQYAEAPNLTQGAWTDVYALAAVMYVAVTGSAPPPSVARMLSDSYAPLVNNTALRERYSARLLTAIDAGLAPRAEDRPPSMAAFRQLLGLAGENAPAIRSVPSIEGRAPGAPPVEPTPGAKRAAGRWGALHTGAALAVLALLGVGGWWALRSSQPVAPVDSPAAAESPPMAAPLPVAQPAPPSATPPRTPAESLAALVQGAASGFEVSATPRQYEVRIDKDLLSFQIRSSRAGYVYVYMLSSDNQLSMLFPNLLDKHNQIQAGQTLTLPRASWPLTAGGPPGTDRFAVLVSEHERDFSDSGLRSDDVFPQFPLSVLAALEAARGNGPPPLLGKPVCASDTACQDIYGVAMLEITEK